MGIEDGISEEKVPILPKNDQDPTPSSTKGGLRTVPFVILNESFEKVASYGLMPNMIFYLMNGYHFGAADGSIILSLWSFASNILAIVGAYVSDSYLGRFRVIALGTFCSLLGVIMLWLTAMIPGMKPSSCAQQSEHCDSASPIQLLILYSSFVLISIGAGFVRPCSMSFGADQFDNKENPNNQRILDSFFHWYYASTGLSTIIALTVIVYIQDKYGWQIGFGVPAVLMVLSLLAFLLGSPLYVHVKAKGSLFTGLIQVPVAAFKKRNVGFPPPDADERYFSGNSSPVTILTDKLRCLNKACIIEDPERELKLDGSSVDPWKLCTVEQVETTKVVLKIFPMWSTGIMMLIALNSSYITLQAKIMDRHIISGLEIPAGSFNIFAIVTITIWVALYDRAVVPLLTKYFGMPHGLGPKLRMAIGLVLCCISMIVAGLVECIRRKKAIEEGFEDQPQAVMDMSAMWLVPQLVLVGLAEGFNAVGQIEFYYSQLPKSMWSLAMGIFTLGFAFSSLVNSILIELIDSFSSMGGNTSWLSSNLNKGHYDYYYWLLAFLGILNFIYFLVICRLYGPSESPSRRRPNHRGED